MTVEYFVRNVYLLNPGKAGQKQEAKNAQGGIHNTNSIPNLNSNSANCRRLQVEVLKTQGGQTWQKRINHGVIRDQ